MCHRDSFQTLHIHAFVRNPKVYNFPSTSPDGSVHVLEWSSLDGIKAPQLCVNLTGSFLDGQLVKVRPSERALHDFLPMH